MATSNEETKKTFNIKFDEIFWIMIFAMKMNRSHPNVKRDWKWIIYIVPAHGVFFLVYVLLMYSIIVHDLKRKDFNQACANGILAVIFNVTTLQYCIMLGFQSVFRDMMHTIDVDYEAAESFSKKEQDIILKYAKKGDYVVKSWLVLISITGSLFLVKSIGLMVYYSVVDEFRLVQLYDLTYPAVIEEVKYERNVFIMLYILFLFYDLYAICMYVAFVPLGAICILHACGQLELVTTRLQGIFEFQDSEYVIQNKIKHIIIHLQDIYSFVQKINEGLMLFYELILKASVILMPITFYQIIQSLQRGDVRVEFISVLIGTMTISGMPCYYSDMLLELVYQQAYAIFNLMNAALE